MTRLLNCLEDDKGVVFGGVYDTGDKLLAAYCRRGIAPESFEPQQSTEISRNFAMGHVTISEPVMLDNKQIGTICICYEL